jgi:signal peptidase I
MTDLVSVSHARTRFYSGLACLFIVAGMAWLAVWGLGSALTLGWSPLAITSDSMAPALRRGDLLLAAPHTGAVLRPGTVAVFEEPGSGSLVSHRIAAVNLDGTYSTRGDANRGVDSTPLRPEQVVGVGRLLVPLVGLPLVWVWSGQWLHLAAWATLTALALWTSRYALSDAYDPWGAGRPPRSRRRPAPSAGPRHRRMGRHRSPVSSARLRPVLLVLAVCAALLSASGLVTSTRAAYANATANPGNSFAASWTVRDVAVTALVAPPAVPKKTTVPVLVTVENLGTTTETFPVSLTDVTRGVLIGSQTVTLAPGATQALTFGWNATPPPGNRTLTASAVLAGDENASNDSMSVTVLIT